MTGNNQQAGKKKQNGFALLILVVVIVLTMTIFYFSTISIVDIKVDNIKKNQQALKLAKQALIAYAVNYPKNHPPRGPGYMLCPDTDNDGVAENSCNGPVTIGRLPWKTLNVGDLRDSANERLWYAVSENFDYTNSPDPPGPSTKTVNTSTRGNISVRDKNKNIIYDGTTIDGAVAVIISPGVALTRADGVLQDRSNINVAVNYLDIDTSIPEDNADFIQGVLGDMSSAAKNGFIQGNIYNGDDVIVNDVVEVITYSELMGSVHKLVSQEISNVINKYFTDCGAYPDAAVFSPGGGAYNSVLNLKKGMLPVESALPLDWGVDHSPYCDLTGIKFPDWVFTEEWHLHTFYEYAYTNASFPLPPLPPNPSPIGTPCTPGINCLTVNSINDKKAVIVFAGRDVTGGRPGNNLSDYFEGENSSPDSIYDTDETEDYVRVVSP